MELNLSNQFLIAMPTLLDPDFHQTVTYIFAHTKEGATGIVINRPLDLHLGELLSQMQLAKSDPRVNTTAVFEGGPVQRDRGFVIHRPTGDWEPTIQVSTKIDISTSRECLQAIANGRGPKQVLVALGYAGWESGQLESEIADNAWLSSPAEPPIIFDIPAESRWRRAAELLGVDMTNISPQPGHA